MHAAAGLVHSLQGGNGLAMEPTYQKLIIIHYLYISTEITSTLTNS